MFRFPKLLFAFLPISLVLGGIFVLIVWSQQSGEFPLRFIEISSELKNVKSDDVKSSLSPYMEKGFFNLDVEDIQKKLSKLPWVDQVTVRRIWPDRVQVSIKELIPQAIWGENGVLSTAGTVFYPDPETLPSQLPHFVGPIERAKDMMQQYFVMLEMLAPLGFSIAYLELSPEGSYRIRLNNGIAIILGKMALNERMARFVLAYQGIEAKLSQIDYLDLRYTNGLAIGWKVEQVKSADQLKVNEAEAKVYEVKEADER